MKIRLSWLATLSCLAFLAPSAAAQSGNIFATPDRPDAEKEYAIGCTPKVRAAPIFNGPRLNDLNERLTALVDRNFSFAIEEMLYVGRRQFASGILADMRGTVAINLKTRRTKFYILTKDWNCSLFRD